MKKITFLLSTILVGFIALAQTTTTRLPLFETFTSSTCGPCTPANSTMETLFANNPGGHVSIKYQMSWPGTGDPYYTTEGGVRRNYYNVNSVPNVAIDGGWNNNGNNLTQAIYNQYKNVPSVLEIDAVYSISGQTVCVDVELNPLEDINFTNLKLFIGIKENRTTANVKTNGETEFFDVMKKLAPDWIGKTMPPLVKGQKVNYSYCYTFNGSYRLPGNASDPINHATEHSVEDFNDISVAVWLQRRSTKEVYQAANAVYVLSVDDRDLEQTKLEVYPNPASDYSTLAIESPKNSVAKISVVNALGQTMYAETKHVEKGINKIKLETMNFAAGIYFVKVEIEKNLQIKKLTVQ